MLPALCLLPYCVLLLQVKLCLSRTSPEKRDLILGFESLMKRAPFWERGAYNTHISKSGCGIRHLRDRARDAAVGSPRLHEGDPAPILLYRPSPWSCEQG